MCASQCDHNWQIFAAFEFFNNLWPIFKECNSGKIIPQVSGAGIRTYVLVNMSLLPITTVQRLPPEFYLVMLLQKGLLIMRAYEGTAHGQL